MKTIEEKICKEAFYNTLMLNKLLDERAYQFFSDKSCDQLFSAGAANSKFVNQIV